MDFTKMNGSKTFEKINWNIDTKDFKFTNPKELYEKGVGNVQVFGFYFNKSKYGLQCNAIGQGFIINLPQHLNDKVDEMLKNTEAVEAIKRGECSLWFYQYDSKFRKNCFGVSFENTQLPTQQQQQNNSPTQQPPIF